MHPVARSITFVSVAALSIFIGACGGAKSPGASCGATFASGWHAKEPSGSGWLRWSDGGGTLRIASGATADLILDGEVLSLARPNAIDVLVDDQKVATWRIDDPAWKSHPFPTLEVHVQAGVDRVVRFVSLAAPVKQPTDPRPLTIALENVTLRRKADSTLCDLKMDALATSSGGSSR